MNHPNRGRSIRLKCLDCMCDQAIEVRRCPITTCALFPWRMGPGAPRGLDDVSQAKSASLEGAQDTGGEI